MIETKQDLKAESILRNRPQDGTTQTGESQKDSDMARSNRKRLTVQEGAQAIERRLSALREQVGVRYATCSIDSFELAADEEVRQLQKEVLSSLRAYSSRLEEQIKAGVGISLFGGIGTGKDFCLSALMLDAVRAGFTVQFRDGMTLMRQFRSAMGGEVQELTVIEPLISCDVLGISDPLPPVGGLSPFAKEKLLTVIDRRYRDRKAIWMTLNVASRSEADERLCPQILDRMVDESLSLSFDWDSYRLSRRWESSSDA